MESRYKAYIFFKSGKVNANFFQDISPSHIHLKLLHNKEVEKMKTLIGISLVIPVVLFGGGVGGFLIGYMPSTPFPPDQSISAKNIVLFGGYGAGGKGKLWFGGMGFGGGANFSASGARYVYSIGAGGPLLEYGKWIGSLVRISVGTVAGGMGENLMRWKDGGDTTKDFIEGTSQGYISIKRDSFFAMPMVGVAFKLRFVNISIYGSYLLAYSIDGWEFDEGKPVKNGDDKFLSQWMVFGGVMF